MGQLTCEVRDGIAWVTFDSGGMNTLSQAAVADLRTVTAEIAGIHAKAALAGVILKGNRFGLGAGANIGELMGADRAELGRFIDVGHETLYAIEEGPLPWVALIDGFALGGIYELALACRAIVATEKATVGFPEIRLNIFPGLGGTQRMPRRSGLVNAADPVSGDAGFTAVLQGKNFRAREALAIRMIDAIVPAGTDPDTFAAQFLRQTVPTLRRETPPDLANAEGLKGMVLPMIQRATMGRPNPRAPYVALDVMVKGAGLPLREAIRIERDAFLEVVTSAEGKAGMRFFFTQQAVQKLPKGSPGKAHDLRRVGVDGADGFMGNAISWLALEAGYEVVAHVPITKFVPAVTEKLIAKYARALKKGAMSQADLDAKLARVKITTDLKDLQGCDLVIEARMENREIKAEFYRALGKGMNPAGLVASNSSSMGPGLLGGFFAEGGGSTKQFLNLHFFSPAEHPMMQLVEVVRGKDTSDDALSTAHAFVRRINKTPIVLQDGSPGFLVNAGLAAYMLEAEKLYREGTPVEAIDAAMRESIFPLGPFELGDQAGLDIAAGMFDTIAAAAPIEPAPLVWKLREAKRFGVKSGAGIYDYADGKRTGVWPGLAALVPGRGNRRFEGRGRRALRAGALPEGARALRSEDRRLGGGVRPRVRLRDRLRHVPRRADLLRQATRLGVGRHHRPRGLRRAPSGRSSACRRGPPLEPARLPSSHGNVDGRETRRVETHHRTVSESTRTRDAPHTLSIIIACHRDGLVPDMYERQRHMLDPLPVLRGRGRRADGR